MTAHPDEHRTLQQPIRRIPIVTSSNQRPFQCLTKKPLSTATTPSTKRSVKPSSACVTKNTPAGNVGEPSEISTRWNKTLKRTGPTPHANSRTSLTTKRPHHRKAIPMSTIMHQPVSAAQALQTILGFLKTVAPMARPKTVWSASSQFPPSVKRQESLPTRQGLDSGYR